MDIYYIYIIHIYMGGITTIWESREAFLLYLYIYLYCYYYSYSLSFFPENQDFPYFSKFDKLQTLILGLWWSIVQKTGDSWIKNMAHLWIHWSEALKYISNLSISINAVRKILVDFLSVLNKVLNFSFSIKYFCQ